MSQIQPPTSTALILQEMRKPVNLSSHGHERTNLGWVRMSLNIGMLWLTPVGEGGHTQCQQSSLCTCVCMFAWTNQLMHRWVTMKGYCQSAASVILPGVMIYLRGASLSEQHTDLLICHCTKRDLSLTSRYVDKSSPER